MSAFYPLTHPRLFDEAVANQIVIVVRAWYPQGVPLLDSRADE